MQQTLTMMLGALFLLSASFLHDQGTQPEAKLVHRFERFSGEYGISEAVIDFAFYPHGSSDMAAVRICSKEPLPLALFTAAADPFVVVDSVADKFPPDHILLIRSEDCVGSHPEVAATELWAIPAGAALPAYVESIKSSQVRSNSIGTRHQGAGGVRNYSAALNNLTTKLRTKKQAVGVVVGYYYKNPSLPIKRRLREARKMLERSGLSQDRYFVRLVPWTGEYGTDPPDPEPRYPSVFIVEVAKDAAPR